MRHVYIRGILGLIWLVTAIVSGVSGKLEMAVLYVLIGGAFLHSVYDEWKKEQNRNGGE